MFSDLKFHLALNWKIRQYFYENKDIERPVGEQKNSSFNNIISLYK